MTQDLLVVCTYTAGSIYEDEARRMLASAERFGYQARAIPVPDQGDWRRNVGIKPKHIFDAIQQHRGPVLSLDSDCLILKPLDELLQLAQDTDIAVKCRPEYCFTGLFNAAVLLVQPTAAAWSVVREWAERGEKYCSQHRFAEQGAFVEGMTLNQHQVRLLPLPDRFHTDTIDGAPAPPECVICHNKVSRQVLPQEKKAAAKRSVSAMTQAAETNPPRKAVYCVTVPQFQKRGGRPLDGAEGTLADFQEFAKRNGVNDVTHATIADAAAHSTTYDLKKIDVIAKLGEMVPQDSRVVLAEYDNLFLRDPQQFEDTLEKADLALAWNHQDAQALPAMSTISFRVTPAIMNGLLPALRQECNRLMTQGMAERVLENAMNNVLRNQSLGLSIAALPAETIADLSSVNHTSTVLAVRSQLSFKTKGTAPCPPPSFLRRTSKSNAFTKPV